MKGSESGGKNNSAPIEVPENEKDIRATPIYQKHGNKNDKIGILSFIKKIQPVLIIGTLIVCIGVFGQYSDRHRQQVQDEILKAQIDESIRFADTLYNSGSFDEAISEYRSILGPGKCSRENFPLRFAKIQYKLGNAHLCLAELRDKETHINQAINAYNESLAVWNSKERYPVEYANVHNGLGRAYWLLADVRNPEANTKEALIHYKIALDICIEQKSSICYGRIRINIGNAYAKLAEVNNTKTNCEKAIVAYDLALKALNDSSEYSEEYAMVLNNLAYTCNILAGQADKKTKEHYSKIAINACQEALEYRKVQNDPRGYSMTKHNLGLAYVILAGVENPKSNLKEAIVAYNDSLRVRNRTYYPLKYAHTQHNLGVAYMRLAKVEDPEANLDRAFLALKNALDIYTLEKYPQEYARTKHIFGDYYRQKAEIKNKENNLENAIIAYREALEIFSEGTPRMYQIAESQLESVHPHANLSETTLNKSVVGENTVIKKAEVTDSIIGACCEIKEGTKVKESRTVNGAIKGL